MFNYNWVCTLLFSPDHQQSYSSGIEKLLAESEKKVTLEHILADSEITKIPLQEIQIGKLIGRGSFGQVFRGTWKGVVVALKLLDFSLLELDENILNDFVTEIRIMNALKHPNIVEFKGISYEVGTKLYLVSELVAFGSLSDLLHEGSGPSTQRQNASQRIDIPGGGNSTNSTLGSLIPNPTEQERYRKPKLTLSNRLKLLITAANGMKYLHQSKVIHRDLKSGNFLVTSDLTCKVADFGISKIKPTLDRTMTSIGTPLYMAPEVICRSRYSYAADVFSFGIMMNEVITNQKPYMDDLNEGHFASEIMLQVCNQGIRPRLPHSLSIPALNSSDHLQSSLSPQIKSTPQQAIPTSSPTSDSSRPYSSSPSLSSSTTSSYSSSLPYSSSPVPVRPKSDLEDKPLLSGSSRSDEQSLDSSSQNPQNSNNDNEEIAVPYVLIQLIEEAWDQDPERRPTFSEIVERLQRIRFTT
eukprot:TRINITY_DN2801_c0_g1_i1.p1 TRINITY_DN2801_c0_g1~~TRINITY_DN2801_c0_g1_i1.p1  ORF type:complete len:469 (+),score=95.81 TRINITY_DN2801_c0_g1_i1:1003-2409(+)